MLKIFKNIAQLIQRFVRLPVAAGFPSGQYPLATRLSEIEYAVSYGVDEIDVVIDRSLVLTHKWKELYTELQAMRKACGTEVRMKTILSVGELSNNDNIYCASIIAMYAGSDFIKTSTGQESVNATLPAGLVLCIAIKDFYELKKQRVKFWLLFSDVQYYIENDTIVDNNLIPGWFQTCWRYKNFSASIGVVSTDRG